MTGIREFWTTVVVSATLWSVGFVLPADAFSDTKRPGSAKAWASSALQMASGNSLLDKIPKFGFGGDQEEPPSPVASVLPSLFTEFTPTPDGLVTRAKVVLASDFGAQDESLLDNDFIWIGPNLGSFVLGKQDYLAAGKFFSLRSSFPDLDYRGHDYRIDEEDPWTVRLTARTVGTMRGELRLRDEVLPPNGKRMQCPPEAISMTFNPKSGKLVKLCSGFTMDRLVGNTYGLCGVMAAAAVAGSPPSDVEIFPLPTVIKRFFGRPVTQLPDPPSVLAPFPETVMIQLAKGVLSASMAADDADLLASSFTYCGSYEGPLNKKDYINNVAQELFAGLEPQLSYFRVDPYDPYRVWVDVRPTGIAGNGATVEGPPQAMSFTFDEDGFCTRITAGAVMDPSIGNCGGLGGTEGIRFAAGEASPGVISRPIPQVIGRLRKLLVSPITKIGVDEYLLEGKPQIEDKPPAARPLTSMEVPVVTVSKPLSPVGKAAARVSAPPKKPKNATDDVRPSRSLFFASTLDKAPTTRISRQDVDSSQKGAVVKKAKEAATKKQQAEKAAREQAAKKAQEARAAANAAKQKAAEAKAAKDAKAAAVKAQKKRAEEARQTKANTDSARKAKATQQARAAAAQKAKQSANPEAPFKNLQFSRTIPLPKLSDETKPPAARKLTKKTPSKEASQKMEKTVSNPFASLFAQPAPIAKKPTSFGTRKIAKTAPKGVPTLSKWKENRDGSVTGNISGAEQFDEGQRVTTSSIAKGIFEAGTVVTTESGSRYFLE